MLINFVLFRAENDDNWIRSSSPTDLLAALHDISTSFPFHLPSILVSPDLLSLSLSLPLPSSSLAFLNTLRSVEVNPVTGENCHLALFSLVYWITQNINKS